MSVDIQWEHLTTGPDGARLAETVRAFVHDKFQQVTLPRFIRSVHVHSFDFGTVSPEIELKDICDPLPDFYDGEDDEDEAASSDGDEHDNSQAASEDDASIELPAGISRERGKLHSRTASMPCESDIPSQQNGQPHAERSAGIHPSLKSTDRPASPFFPTSQTPGIPGGTSNLSYFHLPFAPGLSGTTTPLAAVAGAHFHTGWPENASNIRPKVPPPPPLKQPSASESSSADPTSRPTSQHQRDPADAGFAVESNVNDSPSAGLLESLPLHVREQGPNDIQIVAHVKYSGNLRLSLTAEILLDYPMPSFVGIPLQLNITGLAFDGVAILAYIKKRAHVCFLSPEDAEAFVGQEDDLGDTDDPPASRISQIGGLLEEIKVESEIGQKENGKQVLKNVGKVEKFVLEQVRRIFEDEFVYPSFWTFLV
jgi:distribution and morphology protein 12